MAFKNCDYRDPLLCVLEKDYIVSESETTNAVAQFGPFSPQRPWQLGKPLALFPQFIDKLPRHLVVATSLANVAPDFQKVLACLCMVKQFTH